MKGCEDMNKDNKLVKAGSLWSGLKPFSQLQTKGKPHLVSPP